MKNFNLIILLILVACGNVPTTPDAPQCMPVFRYTEAKDISVSESYCLCRTFHFGLDFVGIVPGTQAYKEPIGQCERLVGWKPDDYVAKELFWQDSLDRINQAINEHSK